VGIKAAGLGLAQAQAKYEPRPDQSTELLKELHILTRDGKLNQDTRRKLKQVQHLLGFIEPLLTKVSQTANKGVGDSEVGKNEGTSVHLVDHGAGKSYLGFLLYDTYFKNGLAHKIEGTVTGIETRSELVARSQALAQRFGFDGMRFVNAAIADTLKPASMNANQHQLPPRVDIVTALHACDTATDDAIAFGLAHNAQHMVLVPCCQAEVAACLRLNKPTTQTLKNNPLAELWRRPIHTREFGSQLTNVLRCLQLESHGYDVTVTELVGWEHSMKNELIVASKTKGLPHTSSATINTSAERLKHLLAMTGLDASRTTNARFTSKLSVTQQPL
jgi:Methyltransferase domain